MSKKNGHAQPWNKGRKLPPEPLSADEVTRLIKQPSRRAPTGIRNRALLVLLYRGGLRCSEALALRPKDLDVDAGTVRVLHGKGDKARLVGLDSGAMAIIQLWIDKRAALGFNGRHTLLCTLQGKPVSSRYVRSLLPRLAAKAGIEKRVHAHGLRHTLASELSAEGVPLPLIQQQLGHANLSTTDRYIRGLAPQEVVDAMKKREWNP
ncbi:MAG: tyrosine-type recombinase/integrase [Planctomycetes bacterium]|nr:tyrosine-type recombinase/integrase [Planctomycetota bacterium]